MLTRYPGVLVGRLAVATKFSNKGIGSEVLDFIKMWFLDDANKTGCRFAIVDAKTNPMFYAFMRKTISRLYSLEKLTKYSIQNLLKAKKKEKNNKRILAS